MTAPVTITLSHDEALVLYEWLHRFNASDPPQPFADQAEQRALWNLEALLESTLVEPLVLEYQRALAAARSRLRDLVE